MKNLTCKRILVTGTWFILLFTIAVSVQAQSMNNLKVYVWDFGTRDRQKTELTRSFTQEFEGALIRTKCCVILERQNYDRLMAQKDNEIAIMSIEGIAESSVTTLKTLEANAVIFGEIYDDVESGEVIITAAVQAFDGENLARENAKLSRGRRLDATSREKSMQELAEKICSSLVSGPPLTPTPPSEAVKITDPRDGVSVSSPMEVSGTYPEDTEDDIWVIVWPENAPRRGYPQSDAADQGLPAFKENGKWFVMSHFGGPPQNYEIAVYTATPSASKFIGDTLKKWVKNNDYPGIHVMDLPEGLVERDRITVSKSQ